MGMDLVKAFRMERDKTKKGKEENQENHQVAMEGIMEGEEIQKEEEKRLGMRNKKER